MKVRAPGKLVLTGAYAVLEGAPAIVVAVDRHAVADGRRNGDRGASREVRFAFESEPPPFVDNHELYCDGRKLGLGSSAASVVAALATRRARRGEDLSDPAIRAALFSEARAAHAQAQQGGSGVDVAASVFGGALRFTMGSIEPLRIPRGLHLIAFSSGVVARTSELRQQVDRLRVQDIRSYAAAMASLSSAAEHGARAFERGIVDSFVMAAHATRHGLAKLGALAGAPIVSENVAYVARCAAAHGAAFLPSGAGGGDVSVYIGAHAPPPTVLHVAAELGFRRLDLAIDHRGVECIELPVARRAS